MKIAICYYGRLRCIDKLFENQNKFLFGEHNVDIFFHTWNGSHITDAEDILYYENQVKFVKENIKPKKFFIEDSKKFDKNFINSPMCSDECFNKNYNPQKRLSNANKPFNVLSMFYSIQQVNSLKKQYEQSNNMIYDCVAQIRTDMKFNQKIDLDSLDLNLINKTWRDQINYPNISDNYMIDHNAISGSKQMDLYSDCFLYAPTYYMNEKISFLPEEILAFHIRDCNLKVNMINSTHELVRSDNFAKKETHFPEL